MFIEKSSTLSLKSRVTAFHIFWSFFGTGSPSHILECTVTHSFIGFNCCWIQARQSHRRIRIVQIVTTTDNQRIVGLLIPNAAVEAVLQGYILDSLLSQFYGCLPPSSNGAQNQPEGLIRCVNYPTLGKGWFMSHNSFWCSPHFMSYLIGWVMSSVYFFRSIFVIVFSQCWAPMLCYPWSSWRALVREGCLSSHMILGSHHLMNYLLGWVKAQSLILTPLDTPSRQLAFNKKSFIILSNYYVLWLVCKFRVVYILHMSGWVAIKMLLIADLAWVQDVDEWKKCN